MDVTFDLFLPSRKEIAPVSGFSSSRRPRRTVRQVTPSTLTGVSGRPMKTAGAVFLTGYQMRNRILW
jgi:hypothetical protein